MTINYRTKAWFLKKLAATKPELTWEIDTHKSIRGHEPFSNHVFCPLTAVAWKHLGQTFGVSQFSMAGAALYLENDLIMDIAHGADNTESWQLIREELLAALGLDSTD
ncbi:MAG: hypothetical protein MN733_17220 [Nitrososphaera sp.]|nr:hypothetical protein [Nitrososphaera sp.]